MAAAGAGAPRSADTAGAASTGGAAGAAGAAGAGGAGAAGVDGADGAEDAGAAKLRLRAIAALGRMGAVSAAERLVPFVNGEPDDAAAALTALTEIRTPAGADAALAALDRDPPREVLVAAMRYLCEMGRLEVLPTLRRLARADDPEIRVAAGMASRALKADRTRDAGERILVALTEKDRAVRAVLARRLRTLPVADVLEQAEMLLGDDPEGVVQILGEVRTAEVTKFLLGVSARADLPVHVRARAVGAVEANEPWERAALAKVIATSKEDAVRAAAAQTMGAFAGLAEVFEHLGPLAADPSPALRGALLWALQLAARPEALSAAERTRCVKELRRALADDDPFVRRRAAYVAGNLHLDALAPDLVTLAKDEEARADLRVAALVGLGELAAPAALDGLVGLFKREEDPQALAAASRAIAATLQHQPDAKIDLGRVQGKIAHSLKSDDATVRAAAVRLAGFAGGAVPAAALLPLARDAAPRAREEALTALGRLGAAEAEPVLVAALEERDPGVQERAAEALLALGGRGAVERLLAFASGEDDGGTRARVAARLARRSAEAQTLLPQLNAALARLAADDPAYEPLLALKADALASQERAAAGGAGGAAGDVDAAVIAAFPTYARLAKVRGFEPLGRSLRTAESLYRTAAGIADADLSPPIVLWMKCLEGYVHAWLAPRLQALQRDHALLCEHVDRLLGESWPTYQRYLAERWSDTVDVGATRVEVPLRSVGNALREYQERRTKRLDSPLSVTEWARLMLFFAVDHPSGPRNVFKVSVRNADQVVRLCHRLHTLAAVRNVVTHRAAAGAQTLDAFRRSYYASFEDLTKLA
jgi:HEAT repeat protein